MKNSQKGFVNIIIAVVVVVAIAGYVAWDNNLIPKNILSRNNTQQDIQSDADIQNQNDTTLPVQSNTANSPKPVEKIVPKTSVQKGLTIYSNKVFSNLFPENWTIEEEVLSSHGCSARVYFVQNSVPKQTLINASTDYLHYLSNPGSVISVSGGIGELGTISVENLKKYLSDTEKDGRTIKLSFFQEDVTETGHKLDINSTSPSLTYYFEFPKYNKKGIAKSVVLGGQFPQTISIYYIAPVKDFSEDWFNTITSSIKNNLTVSRCDPFENSTVKKDQKIAITLPSDKTWKEGNTYKVSWSTDLPLSSFSYYYVQLGSDIPKRVASNPGSYGLWKVDKSKNSLEIKLNKNIINEQLYNSSNRNFDGIKNTFFIRVTAFNEATPAWNANPSADSSLFSIEEPATIPIVNQQSEQEAIVSIANITASMANFRQSAELVYNNNLSYASICSGGLINVNASTNFQAIINSILTHQGASNQSNAGITCVAMKDKYAIEVAFKKYSTTRGIRSYCIDSSGVSGDDTRYILDQASFSCKAQ